MKAIISIAFVFVCLTAKTVTLAKYQDDGQLHWWDTVRGCTLFFSSTEKPTTLSRWFFQDDNDEYKQDTRKRIPFPQCLVSKSGSRLFDSSSIQKLFDRKLREEEESLRYEGYENYEHHNGK